MAICSTHVPARGWLYNLKRNGEQRHWSCTSHGTVPFPCHTGKACASRALAFEPPGSVCVPELALIGLPYDGRQAHPILAEPLEWGLAIRCGATSSNAQNMSGTSKLTPA